MIEEDKKDDFLEPSVSFDVPKKELNTPEEKPKKKEKVKLVPDVRAAGWCERHRCFYEDAPVIDGEVLRPCCKKL